VGSGHSFVPVICLNTVSEPHDCSGLVHWCGCVYTRQRKLQQEHTLQVAAFEFKSVHKLSGVRERPCKMCLASSLHAHAFPKMLRIPALDHTTGLCARIHPLLPCVLVSCLLDRKSKSRSVKTVWDSTVDFFAGKLLVLGQNPIFFHQKSLRCDFLLFRLVGWLVGCDLVSLLGMNVSTTFSTVPLGILSNHTILQE